jgi:1-acyl-sn-glycerol-3-phosphate acyltransferase
MQFHEELIKLYTNGYLRLFSLKCNVEGDYPLPDGAKIIAANHPNATDSFHLVPVLSETPHFLMRSHLFSKPIIGWLLNQAGQIQVANNGKKPFQEACRQLELGHTIVIYPEGKLNPRYEKMKVKTGAIRMALESGAPIIPLGIYVPQENLRDIQPYHLSKGCWQISGTCHLRFGIPWYPNSHEKIPILSKQLMNRINGLVYETKKKLSCESHTSLNPIPQW